MRLAACLLMVALALAGCLSGTGPADPAGDGGTDDGEVPSSGPVPTQGNATAPTLAEPPVWREGMWWRYRVTERFTGTSYEADRVVTGEELGTNTYLVGMPRDTWLDKALVLHVPGFGRVGQEDLSFEIHDCPFKPLDFPVTDGKTWQTEFECRNVNATATVRDDTTVEVEMVGDNDHITLTYDAEIGAVTRFDIQDYAEIEIIDSGTGFNGTVTVPHNHDLVFRHGRIAGAVGLDLAPAGPVESVDVDETYHRVSFVFILGSVLPDTSSPNTFYREEATAPDGTTYEATATPADGTGLVFEFHQHDDPGGTWDLRHVAAGPGIAMIEGIGYHVFDEPVGNS